MKFIHMADVHLGASPDKGQPWATDSAQIIWDSFERVLHYATKEQVDLLLISGDFFHQSPTLQDLKKLDYLLGKMPYTKTLWIAGNHDHLYDGAPLCSYEFQSDTICLTGESMARVYIEAINTWVYGFSYWNDMIREPLYDGMKPEEEEGYHLLLAHGGDSNHIPLDREQLKWSGFDYIALGHIHEPQMIYEDLMAYAGSLEPLDHTEMGEHGFFLGEFSEEKQVVSFVPFAKRQYVDTEVLISEDMSPEEILDRIETEISYRGEDKIHRIILEGQMDSKISPDYHLLQGRYMISDIVSQAATAWDYDVLKDEEDPFVKEIADLLKDQPQALAYAMEALDYAKE